MEFNKLKSSIWQLLSTFHINREQISKFKSLIHIPSLRIEPSILIYFIFHPNSLYLILSEKVRIDFEKEYNQFVEFFNNEIIDEIPQNIRSYYSNFPMEFNKIDIMTVKDEDFNDLEYFKDLFESISIQILKEYRYDEIIIDVTGGTKLHSIVATNFAIENNIAYSYLSVIEQKNESGILAKSGTERLYIKYPDSKKLNYLSIFSFPIISIFENEVTCFYDGVTKIGKFSMDEEKQIKIKEMFENYSIQFEDYLRFNLVKMLEPDFTKLKNLIKSCFSDDFLNEIENFLNPGKIFAISLNNKFWNFPFEYAFNYYCDFLLLRSIPDLQTKNGIRSPIKYQNNNNNKNDNSKYSNSDNTYNNKNEKNKKDYDDSNEKNYENKNIYKIKIVLASLSNDDLMKNQYEKLNSLFNNRNLNNQIEINSLFLPDKAKFLQTLQDCDIAHIISHGGICQDKQTFVVENIGNDKTNHQSYLYPEDFENIHTGKLIFISACSSLTLNIDWDKTIYYQFIKNGTKTIIGTHWAILQEESLDISLKFYENFLSGEPVGKALHDALKEIDKDFLYRNYYILGNHTLSIK